MTTPQFEQYKKARDAAADAYDEKQTNSLPVVDRASFDRLRAALLVLNDGIEQYMTNSDANIGVIDRAQDAALKILEGK